MIALWSIKVSARQPRRVSLGMSAASSLVETVSGRQPGDVCRQLGDRDRQLSDGIVVLSQGMYSIYNMKQTVWCVLTDSSIAVLQRLRGEASGAT